MNKTTLQTHIVNLFILGTAIILVFVAKRNFKDYFVANVPHTAIGNGGYPTNPQGGYPQGQPMRFPKQLYPARVPYQPKPDSQPFVNPQNGWNGYGATGVCTDGVCHPKQFDKTVFNIPT